ncbi:Hypothetical predicted protein [Scomber scombrus]|uniref:Uncharacterized protein n=1 Tax=Scomber scombrus TaxID=13677 RepID=A0AAV1MUT4_SCOSC
MAACCSSLQELCQDVSATESTHLSPQCQARARARARAQGVNGVNERIWKWQVAGTCAGFPRAIRPT